MCGVEVHAQKATFVLTWCCWRENNAAVTAKDLDKNPPYWPDVPDRSDRSG